MITPYLITLFGAFSIAMVSYILILHYKTKRLTQQNEILRYNLDHVREQMRKKNEIVSLLQQQRDKHAVALQNANFDMHDAFESERLPE